MMTYQRAFEASSRIVVMADELMQTILNLKR
jgi:flagellar hook protein FlgE